MTALLQAVVEVRVGQPESWLTQNAGSFAVALAAIVAAGLAAFVATRNHQHQLSNDRDIRNRAHIRNTLDVAVEGATSAINETTGFSSFLEVGVAMSEIDGDAPSAEEHEEFASAYQGWGDELMAKMMSADNAVLAMRTHNIRIELRLGEDHPITVHHERLRAGLAEWDEALRRSARDATPAGLDQAEDEKHQAEDEKHLDRLATVLNEFRIECRRWFREQERPLKVRKYRRWLPGSRSPWEPRSASSEA